MKTIRHNATRKIAAIRTGALHIRAYTLANDFIAQITTANAAFTALESYDFAKLTDHENGMYTVHIHDNYWYRVYTSAYFHNLGRIAYAAEVTRAPALDGTLTRLLAGMPVGTGADALMSFWLEGFDAAADEAAATILAEEA